jgi:hypothetical protein
VQAPADNALHEARQDGTAVQVARRLVIRRRRRRTRLPFHLLRRRTFYAVLVGGANVDFDLLELTDVRSYKLQVDQPAVHGRLNNVWARVY